MFGCGLERPPAAIPPYSERSCPQTDPPRDIRHYARMEVTFKTRDDDVIDIDLGPNGRASQRPCWTPYRRGHCVAQTTIVHPTTGLIGLWPL
jgi:hypothetical protein